MNTINGSMIAFTGIQRQYNNLREEILDVTDRVLTTGQLMSGAWTNHFEDWLAYRNHVQYAVTCHSGTQALEIIAGFYREQRADQPTVLIPAMTYIATANAWVNAGWRLHIVDTDAYGLMNPASVPESLEFAAVCNVGLYGAAATQWYEHHKQYVVIEDGAQHWLANNCQRRGAACAISFDPTKNLANYGNGGAVVTNRMDLANYARDWCTNGRDGYGAEHVTNSRMSEVDCAQMMVKTKYIDRWQQRRRDIAEYWISRLADSPVRCLINASNVDKHCFHKFVIDVDRRDQMQIRLADAGISTKVHYSRPIHEEPRYINTPGPNMLSTASSLARRCLSLPIYPELTDSETEYIVSQVLSCVE
jgi:dTDP-4-amino-4,6-dideoxygalactose transaminase